MVELFATLALLLSCGWAAYLVAARWLPAAATSVRWCAAAVVGYWTLIGAFFALASASQFRVGVAVPFWVACAVALHLAAGHGRAGMAALRGDWRRVAAGWNEWRQTRYGVLLVVAGGAMLLLRSVRSLLAPPLTWDALTYHLLKAGRWVQTGGFVPERAPDAWGYYEYFHPFGDYLWAWAMLPVHGDLLIGPAGVLVWATCLLGTYTLARTLGIGGVPSVAAALFIGFNPTVFNYITSAHVENVLLATFVLAGVFIARSFADRDWVNPVLAAAALGVLAGVKFNGAPVAVVGVIAIAIAVVRQRAARVSHPDGVWTRHQRGGDDSSRRVRAAFLRDTGPTYAALVLAGCGVVLALGAVPYLRAWHDTGSPIYPFQLEIAGRTLVAGNPELTWLMARDDQPQGPLWQELFVPREFDLVVGREQFLNPGPAALLVGLAGLLGAVGALRRVSGSALHGHGRPVAIFMLIASAITIAGVATSDVTALRTVWIQVFGRFLLVPLASAAIFAALLAPRVSVPLLTAAMAINVPLTIPLGWGPADWAALTDPRLLVVAVAVGLVALVVRVTLAQRRWPRYLTGTLGVVTTAVLVGAWIVVRDVRETHRHTYFREAADERVYDPHRLAFKETAGYPLWRQFDRQSGLSLAVSAGWNEYGHNWFRYPLLGSRLQNRVVYVPITRDGTVVDYRDEARIRAGIDYHAWLRRLVAGRVDYVVLLHPEPPEAAWVHAHPDVFMPAGDGRAGMARAYRLNHAVAAAVAAPAVTPQVAAR